MSNKVGLILPAYNEELGILKTLHCTKGISVDLITIFVDDGSSDRTASLIETNLDKGSQVLIKSKVNLGYGGACRVGVNYASEKNISWVIFADCDLTNPLSDILKMVEMIKLGSNIDLIKGDRFHRQQSLKGIEWRRRVMTRMARSLSKFCFQGYVSDPTNGFRAARVNLLKSCPTTVNDFSVILEELYYFKNKNAQAVNFPTFLESRGTGQRPTSFRYSTDQIKKYLYWCLMAAKRSS